MVIEVDILWVFFNEFKLVYLDHEIVMQLPEVA